MSEEDEDKIDPPAAAAAEKPDATRVRDEKGLTVGNRLLLRAVLEERRIVMAAGRMGGDTSFYNSLEQDTLVDLLDDLMFYARLMGERLGAPDELIEHLRKSEKADLEELRRLRDETHDKINQTRDELTQMRDRLISGMRPATCDLCGKPMCPSCGSCHAEHLKVSIN